MGYVNLKVHRDHSSSSAAVLVGKMPNLSIDNLNSSSPVPLFRLGLHLSRVHQAAPGSWRSVIPSVFRFDKPPARHLNLNGTPEQRNTSACHGKLARSIVSRRPTHAIYFDSPTLIASPWRRSTSAEEVGFFLETRAPSPPPRPSRGDTVRERQGPRGDVTGSRRG